jgi:hypothetical protein
LPGRTNIDVLISGNTIMDRVGSQITNPADGLQGITIFDSAWDGMRVENNVVVSPTWHGISLYGVQHLEIINNTVLSTSPARATWINVGPRKGEKGPIKYTTVVRNNISSLVAVRPELVGVVVDHNVITKNPKSVVKEFDAAAGRYDLHLSKHSAAIGAGSPDSAPKTDIEDHDRGAKIDAGAYAAGPF